MPRGPTPPKALCRAIPMCRGVAGGGGGGDEAVPHGMHLAGTRVGFLLCPRHRVNGVVLGSDATQVDLYPRPPSTVMQSPQDSLLHGRAHPSTHVHMNVEGTNYFFSSSSSNFWMLWIGLGGSRPGCRGSSRQNLSSRACAHSPKHTCERHPSTKGQPCMPQCPLTRSQQCPASPNHFIT